MQLNKDRLVSEFIELVKIDSESGHEEKIAVVLKAKLEALGLKVVEDDAKEKTNYGANNIIATLKAKNAQAAPIFFNAHMDTVKPGIDIKPQIEDGMIRSDGTTILGADDKAGVAAILEMLHVIKEQNLDHGQIQVIFTVGEETGLVGAKALDARLIDAKYGFTVDSSGDVGGFITSAPSQAKVELFCKGKSSHAGLAPEKGISAIKLAAKAISNMTLGRIDHETTANVGRIEGGKATNIVSEEAYILSEVRSLDRKKLDDQIESMRQACRKAEEDVGGEIDVKVTMMYEGYKFEGDEVIINVAEEAVRLTGLEPKPQSTGGGSDANVISGYGFPVLNLCAGYEKVHTPEEQISVESLENISKLLVNIVNVVTKQSSQ